MICRKALPKISSHINCNYIVESTLLSIDSRTYVDRFRSGHRVQAGKENVQKER